MHVAVKLGAVIVVGAVSGAAGLLLNRPAEPGPLVPPVKVASVGRKVAVRVSTKASRRKIDDFVYGANFLVNDKHTTKLKFPLVRWGGNATTRHNWKLNTSNRAADWFFQNIPDETYAVPGKGAVGITDMVILKHKPNGTEVLFTLPTIGWTPNAREKRWAYSVKKYGPQQKTDPYEPDSGNGIDASGKVITKNDPSETSQRISPRWNVDWLGHMRELLGGKDAKNGGMRFFALDNEPDLWHATHRDVRQSDPDLKSSQLSYDELWQRTKDYAGAIKSADPSAIVTGPVAWGWCNYFSSAVDVDDGDGDCMNGKDRKAHGGEPILKWYLRQVCAHEKATGVRLVDYLDVHFYPEDLSLDSEDPPVARDRLSRLRALYDPTFKDPSWIKEQIALIPRLKGWIEDSCPAVKLAISEYRFGYDADGVSSALAEAEALAIFGREGVDLATVWGTVTHDSRFEDAFKLFLDYDGLGSSALSGTSVLAESGESLMLPVYAVEVGKGAALLVYIFNKSDAAALDAELRIDTPYKTVRLFRLSQTQRLAEIPAPSWRGGPLRLTLPARSATLAVLKP